MTKGKWSVVFGFHLPSDRSEITQPLFNISNFSDVFDEEYFIHSLANDVKVEKKLPKDLVKAPKFVRYFKSWSGIDYYHDEIYPLWEHRQVCIHSISIFHLPPNNLKAVDSRCNNFELLS